MNTKLSFHLLYSIELGKKCLPNGLTESYTCIMYIVRNGLESMLHKIRDWCSWGLPHELVLQAPLD